MAAEFVAGHSQLEIAATAAAAAAADLGMASVLLLAVDSVVGGLVADEAVAGAAASADTDWHTVEAAAAAGH